MTRYKWRQVPGYVFLTVFSIFSVFPLYFMAVSATNTSQDVLGSRMIPGGNLVQNFTDLLDAADLWSAMLNSALIAVGTTVLALLVSSIAGYGFEIYHSKGKDLLMAVLLLAMMVPQVATMVPLFKMMSKADLLNSVWAFILPSISTPFLIMMFRQNSRNFPNDLMQAARIDGLSETGIFFRMYVPIMKSTYAAAAVITFRPCRHRDD